MKLLYITKRFPRLSETFILDEMIGLERNGIELTIFAIANPNESKVHTAAKKLIPSVQYLHDSPSPAWHDRFISEIVDGAWCFARRPIGVFSAIFACLKPSRLSIGSVKHLLEAFVVARYAIGNEVDQIHGAFAHSPASVADFAGQISGIPFSFAGHAKDIYTLDKLTLKSRLERACYVLCCSDSAYQFLHNIEPAARVVLAPHGVDSERLASMAEQRRTKELEFSPANPLRLLCIGRLVPKKGISDLIDAVHLLNASGIPVILQVAGGGELRDVLTSQARDLGIESLIELRGSIDSDEIQQLLRWADIYVQPSVELKNGDRDGIPNSLLEAMAAGLPIVATAVAGIPEVVGPDTGILVTPGDGGALAVAIRQLINDPKSARRLGDSAALEVSNNWSRPLLHSRLAKMMIEHCQSPLSTPFDIRDLALGSNSGLRVSTDRSKP